MLHVRDSQISSSSSSSGHGSHLPAPALVGIAVGAIVSTVLLGACAFMLARSKRNRTRRERDKAMGKAVDEGLKPVPSGAGGGGSGVEGCGQTVMVLREEHQRQHQKYRLA